MLLKFLPVFILAGCAGYNAASQANDYLAQETRYTADADAIGRYEHRYGADQTLRAQDEETYSRLSRARNNQYSPASVADVTSSIDMLEKTMNAVGVSPDGSRTVSHP